MKTLYESILDTDFNGPRMLDRAKPSDVFTKKLHQLFEVDPVNLLAYKSTRQWQLPDFGMIAWKVDKGRLCARMENLCKKYCTQVTREDATQAIVKHECAVEIVRRLVDPAQTRRKPYLLSVTFNFPDAAEECVQTIWVYQKEVNILLDTNLKLNTGASTIAKKCFQEASGGIECTYYIAPEACIPVLNMMIMNFKKTVQSR